MITAESLLSIKDRDVQEVEIKGGKVFVRSLTVSEHYSMEASNKEVSGNLERLTANQIAAYACNEDGDPIFTSEQAVLFVQRRHPETIKAIIESAMTLNGYGKGSREELKGNS